MNPAAKARRANKKPVDSSTPEKNCFEMVTARAPYKKKSYHSKTVPREAAKTSFRCSVESPDHLWIAAAEVKWVSRSRHPVPAPAGTFTSAALDWNSYVGSAGAQTCTSSPKKAIRFSDSLCVELAHLLASAHLRYCSRYRHLAASTDICGDEMWRGGLL